MSVQWTQVYKQIRNEYPDADPVEWIWSANWHTADWDVDELEEMHADDLAVDDAQGESSCDWRI